jgi:hypothetical protein
VPKIGVGPPPRLLAKAFAPKTRPNAAARERIHRFDVRVQMLTAHQMAHATCRPGIAAYRFATDATGPDAQLPQV